MLKMFKHKFHVFLEFSAQSSIWFDGKKMKTTIVTLEAEKQLFFVIMY